MFAAYLFYLGLAILILLIIYTITCVVCYFLDDSPSLPSNFLFNSLAPFLNIINYLREKRFDQFNNWIYTFHTGFFFFIMSAIFSLSIFLILLGIFGDTFFSTQSFLYATTLTNLLSAFTHQIIFDVFAKKLAYLSFYKDTPLCICGKITSVVSNLSSISILIDNDALISFCKTFYAITQILVIFFAITGGVYLSIIDPSNPQSSDSESKTNKFSLTSDFISTLTKLLKYIKNQLSKNKKQIKLRFFHKARAKKIQAYLSIFQELTQCYRTIENEYIVSTMGDEQININPEIDNFFTQANSIFNAFEGNTKYLNNLLDNLAQTLSGDIHDSLKELSLNISDFEQKFYNSIHFKIFCIYFYLKQISKLIALEEYRPWIMVSEYFPTKIAKIIPIQK